MSKQIQREGDVNDASAPIVSANQGTVYLNGRLVAVNGAAVGGHGDDIHHAPVTVSSSTVFVDGKPITRAGDVDTCGHIRIGGSPDCGGG